MTRVDGVLIIDKPAGMTSHDVVAAVRRLLGERRVGHTGTLDPFATGVLVVLIGRATRLAQFLSGAEKEYEAVIRLGFATDTGDVTGKELTTETRRTPSFSNDEIEEAMARFRGDIEQTPPMFSAKKVAGEKLYELARRGETIERKSVRVTIGEFALVSGPRDNEDGTCDLAVRVVCSAGTYVRTLAEDFGRSLGTGAHVAELRRTRAGTFTIETALALDRLEQTSAGSVSISLDAALSHLPFVDLDQESARRVQHGIDVPAAGAQPLARYVRLRDQDGNLIAVGIYDDSRQAIHPEVVISTTD